MPRLNFRPETDGFHFPNDFTNNFSTDLTDNIPQVGNAIKTRGLCGGMILAAFNYFRYGLAIPPHLKQDVKLNVPFNLLGTDDTVDPVISYIYHSQIASFQSLDIANFISPFAPAYDDQFAKIKHNIDNSRYLMLGLRLRPGSGAISGHQVLCYGYRQAGKVIYVYDPNFPDVETKISKTTVGGNQYIHVDAAGTPDNRYESIFLLHQLYTTKRPNRTSYNTLENLFGDLNLAVRPPIPSQEAGWRWCSKCQALFFSPNRSESVCPAGGTHSGSRSSRYRLLKNYGVSRHESHWSRCLRCQSLAFARNVSTSRCPAGGNHRHSAVLVVPGTVGVTAPNLSGLALAHLPINRLGTNNYTLLLERQGNRLLTQKGWRRCPKCQCLHHEHGVCAADGERHAVAAARQYSLLR